MGSMSQLALQSHSAQTVSTALTSTHQGADTVAGASSAARCSRRHRVQAPMVRLICLLTVSRPRFKRRQAVSSRFGPPESGRWQAQVAIRAQTAVAMAYESRPKADRGAALSQHRPLSRLRRAVAAAVFLSTPLLSGARRKLLTGSHLPLFLPVTQVSRARRGRPEQSLARLPFLYTSPKRALTSLSSCPRSTKRASKTSGSTMRPSRAGLKSS